MPERAMPEHVERTYRRTASPDLVSFEVRVMQTDLLIAAVRDLSAPAEKAVRACRARLEAYIERDPGFKEALAPYRLRRDAPQIARTMAAAGKVAGVGPMAAVAGAIAQHVGRALAPHSPELIVENGGDIWLQGRCARTVGIFAGQSPLTGKLGVRVEADLLPAAICTSSGTVGPSLSFGRADAAIALAASGALADAAATAIGNIIHGADDIASAIEFAQRIPGLLGAVVIVDEHLGAYGQVELVPLSASGQGRASLAPARGEK